MVHSGWFIRSCATNLPDETLVFLVFRFTWDLRQHFSGTRGERNLLPELLCQVRQGWAGLNCVSQGAISIGKAAGKLRENMGRRFFKADWMGNIIFISFLKYFVIPNFETALNFHAQHLDPRHRNAATVRLLTSRVRRHVPWYDDSMIMTSGCP